MHCKTSWGRHYIPSIVFLFNQGEPGASGLRGPEGAPGIGTQGEKVLHSLIFLIFNSVRVSFYMSVL